MTRFFVIISVLISSASGFAGDAPARPKTLHCLSPGAWGPAADFTIDNLNEKSPTLLDLDAADNNQLDTTGSFTQISGNNGCDDDYDIVFSTNDLELAAAGKLKQVQGMMNYFNGYMDETVSERVSAVLTCEVTAVSH